MEKATPSYRNLQILTGFPYFAKSSFKKEVERIVVLQMAHTSLSSFAITISFFAIIMSTSQGKEKDNQ